VTIFIWNLFNASLYFTATYSQNTKQNILLLEKKVFRLGFEVIDYLQLYDYLVNCRICILPRNFVFYLFIDACWWDCNFQSIYSNIYNCRYVTKRSPELNEYLKNFKHHFRHWSFKRTRIKPTCIFTSIPRECCFYAQSHENKGWICFTFFIFMLWENKNANLQLNYNLFR
jgi:hypothetical protein